MKRLISIVCATAMTGATMLTGITAAQAMPMPRSAPAQVSADVIHVQGRPHQSRRDQRRAGARGFERRGGHAYYRGHRGQRSPRAGWRQHQGWWFPPAAFVAGAIIGGAMSQQPARAAPRLSNAHINWCHNRWRSYRASDNTYQPYNGPRQQCRSPYY